AVDAEAVVRVEVAGWPGTRYEFPQPPRVTHAPLPTEVYRRLAADAEPDVRAALGRNNCLPEAVRAVLAGDPDPEVRRCAALDALPTPLLHQLIGDADPDVRRAALLTARVHASTATIPQRLAEQIIDDSDMGREWATELVQLTPALLDRLWAQPE